MTKKLMFLLDTDPVPSVFDTVVGYDGGADHVIGYGGVTPENAAALVDGTIYTRGPKEKQNTAIFVGGGNMTAGEAVFEAVKKRFFANFRVSVMLDSNGSNTTAAAGVALLAKAKPLRAKKAVVLAGTGPVGMRAAAMLHIEGSEVAITSRTKQRANAASKAIEDRFGFAPAPIEAVIYPGAYHAWTVPSLTTLRFYAEYPSTKQCPFILLGSDRSALLVGGQLAPFDPASFMACIGQAPGYSMVYDEGVTAKSAAESIGFLKRHLQRP